MVSKKTASNPNWITDELDRIREYYGPVLKERFYVIEHTPAYNTGGYYDQNIPAKNRMVSPYFDTEDEAKAWMDEHEPDKGKFLHIWKDQLFERKIREWKYDYGYNRTRPQH